MDTGSLDKLHDITIKIIMHIYFLALFLHVDDVFGSCGRLYLGAARFFAFQDADLAFGCQDSRCAGGS